MPAATFLGTAPRTYTQYLDVDPDPGGTTLVAEPRNTYQIAVADTWQVGTTPGDGLWGHPSAGTRFNAIPGRAVAGNSPPGYLAGRTLGDSAAFLGGSLGGALTFSAPVTATFLGNAPRTYTQYLDIDPEPGGTTLVAEPYNTYQILIADTWRSLDAIPGDGLWAGIPPLPGGGFNAVPGRAVVGESSPGDPGTGTPGNFAVLGSSLGDALTFSAPVTATFLGNAPRTYTQYLDTDPDSTGTTLVAEPYNTYQISIADTWQGLGAIPGDGLWSAAPRSVLSFTITPGSAVIGGMTIGFPGFTSATETMEDMLTAPAPETRVLTPTAHVVRGRGRKLRPAPARRAGHRRELAGARRGRH